MALRKGSDSVAFCREENRERKENPKHRKFQRGLRGEGKALREESRVKRNEKF